MRAGKVTDIYDRHSYAKEDKAIMEAVGASLTGRTSRRSTS